MNQERCDGSARAISRSVLILENTPIARDTFRLRLGVPDLAQIIRPGQFVMVRPGPRNSSDPLLGRPLALYDVVCGQSGVPESLDIVYLVVGRGTATLAQRKPGEQVTVWGPLGNGFGPPPDGPALFVAGGIGQTPFLALGRAWLRDSAGPRSVTLLYGARTKALLAGVDDFCHAGIPVELATDDGTAGYHGFVTDLLARRLGAGEKPAMVVGCGPPAMLSALAKLALSFRVPCDVSLENHMACGFGACFSCVAPLRQNDGSFDLRRVCIEGPVVAANRVDWAAMTH